MLWHPRWYNHLLQGDQNKFSQIINIFIALFGAKYPPIIYMVEKYLAPKENSATLKVF